MTSPSAATREMFGLSIDALTLDQTVELCRSAVLARRRLLVGVVNAAKVVNLRRDALLRDSLLDCDIILADGQSVVWASKILTDPLPERVTGIDLFTALLAMADAEHRSVYLLGARPEVVKALVDRIGRDYPGATIAGARDGYFNDTEAAEVAHDIRRSGADMLFLGMVSPKKEVFLSRYSDVVGTPVMHGVGGSFDVLAGVTRRAPQRWQRWGLEWAYRLKQEPGRLWKRYMRTNTRFVLQVLIERVKPTPRWQSHPTRVLAD